MKRLATERLINRTRYLFTVFFVATGFASYKGGSDPRVYLAIFGCSAIFLLLGLVNEIPHSRQRVVPAFIWASTTVELGLFFFVRWAFSFEPSTGYSMSMKEPATFCVYFLFGILNGLRFDRRLNLYYGVGGILVQLVLIGLALTVGGLHFSSDPARAFELGTLRLASEAAKVMFMLLFTIFLVIMAGYTRRSMKEMEDAQRQATDNADAVKKLLGTVQASAEDVLRGSHELVSAVGSISGIIGRNHELLGELATLSSTFSQSIVGVNGKSRDQFEAAQRSAARIDQLLALLKELQGTSSAQGGHAQEALRQAEENDSRLSSTLAAIGDMRGRSEKIDEISRTIRDIADQTNLLSLNASIEAARAGEHGRGFAVVAAEINKLAGRSAESSALIEQIIRETVHGIGEVSRTVESMAGSLGGISTFVRQNSRFMEELTGAMAREQEEGAHLRRETQAVDALAQEIRGAAEEQDRLNQSISSWTSAMTSTSEEIARTLEGLSELSARLGARSRAMSAAMSGGTGSATVTATPPRGPAMAPAAARARIPGAAAAGISVPRGTP